jgi:negative regulator of sigma E activity
MAGGSVEARHILRQLAVSARQTGFSGKKVIINLSRRSPEITSYSVIHLNHGLERREYPDLGKVVINREGWQWEYYPAKSLVIKRRNPADDQWDLLQEDNLDQIMESYQVDLAEGMPILGRESLAVRFEPIDRGSRPARKVWLDRTSGLPLRGEIYGVDGTLYLVSHFELLDFDPKPRRDAFQIRDRRAKVMEADADVTMLGRRRLPGVPQPSIWKPAELPQGFTLQRVRQSGRRPRAEFQQLYSDGLSSLSLFERAGGTSTDAHDSLGRPVTIGSSPGTLHDYGLLRAVTWHVGGRSFVLVGDVSADLLLRVAASVGRASVPAGRHP